MFSVYMNELSFVPVSEIVVDVFKATLFRMLVPSYVSLSIVIVRYHFLVRSVVLEMHEPGGDKGRNVMNEDEEQAVHFAWFIGSEHPWQLE